jgi:hypothetical protein
VRSVALRIWIQGGLRFDGPRNLRPLSERRSLWTAAGSYRLSRIRAARRRGDARRDRRKQSVSPTHQSALRSGIREAAADGHIASGNAAQAAAIYDALATERPNDVQVRLADGEALLADRQFAAACAEFDELRGKGLGPRDLGVTAARACAQKEDAAVAIAWIDSIPARFRPDLSADPALASLRDRAEFRPLFPR